MKLYIVMYTHRHGVDVWPHFVKDGQPEPTAEDEIDQLEDWEPDRGEFVEVSGPFVVPNH